MRTASKKKGIPAWSFQISLHLKFFVFLKPKMCNCAMSVSTSQPQYRCTWLTITCMGNTQKMYIRKFTIQFHRSKTFFGLLLVDRHWNALLP